MANFTADQLQEIEKILKYISQLSGIVRTSPSKDQVDRVKKQIGQYADKLTKYLPHLDRNRINVDEIRRDLGLGAQGGSRVAVKEEAESGAFSNQHDFLSRYPIQPACPNSTDRDVNMLATVIRTLQKEYWPVISDQHCKLDFSHGAERDNIRNHLDAAYRNLAVLIETIEEYAQAQKQDFREQLQKMKSKQSRLFLYETNEVLKKVREFLRKLIEDLDQNGSIVVNKGDTLKFNSRFEEATVLEGISLESGIREFEEFLNQAISALNLPDIKQR